MKIISFCVMLFISESKSKQISFSVALTKRSVFDIIPGSDFNKDSRGKHNLYCVLKYKVETKLLFFTGLVGTQCYCNNGAHQCIYDEQLRCRRRLEALSQSEELQIRERAVRTKRRESRRLFKRLLRKWMKEDNNSYKKG